MARGKLVRVVMSRNDVFVWQNGPSFVGRLIHQPQDTGDWFHFDVHGVGVVKLNPMSVEFVGIVEEKQDANEASYADLRADGGLPEAKALKYQFCAVHGHVECGECESVVAMQRAIEEKQDAE